ncbi:hypothetical protein NEHOM01_0395 [Nematocida homosporus]|uniref:uncharacterized protein n=1 Tax=Nematocida homosporus TaxID=1912981 RepID=UPI00222128F3|nr:uncharacterized protein NEHOM01_0395 [Nematocida homosporus]KAI5184793.1 hypothetical protein NEHOM01_0395 [Nematocida homosporus]
MSIVYIPILSTNGRLHLEESLPSVLHTKVPETEWSEIIQKLNSLLLRRKRTRLLRLLTLFYLGTLYQRYIDHQIDREIAAYLNKKNLVLEVYGISLHHPRDRAYQGMDVSVYLMTTAYFTA